MRPKYERSVRFSLITGGSEGGHAPTNWPTRTVRPYAVATMPHGAREVRVSLPDTVFGAVPWRPEGIADEMRLLWLIEQVRERRLGSAKAAEIAGVPLARFLPLLGKHGVSVFDLDPGELAAEFEGT